jgi:hypothetical protein
MIPIAATIGIIFDISRNPTQLLIMTGSFLILSWINWSRKLVVYAPDATQKALIPLI